MGRIRCSRVPRRWSACPRRRISFFRRNRRGYCCTNARVERSFLLEGLVGQAASTGRRTGSCCCSCKSAISVGEAWWSGPLGLPQCLRLQTAPLHCTSTSGQLLYTVCRQLLYTLSTSNPACSARFCSGAGWGVREAGWKHE